MKPPAAIWPGTVARVYAFSTLIEPTFASCACVEKLNPKVIPVKAYIATNSFVFIISSLLIIYKKTEL
jgi:hypothetical protein